MKFALKTDLTLALKFYPALQTTLLHFWEKTSHTMAAIHESFKGYQPYEFTMLKVRNI